MSIGTLMAFIAGLHAPVLVLRVTRPGRAPPVPLSGGLSWWPRWVFW